MNAKDREQMQIFWQCLHEHCAEQVNCEEVAQYLLETPEDELWVTACLWLETHVSECSRCQSEDAQWQQWRLLVQRSCCEQAPAQLRMRIVEQITLWRDL